MITSYKYVLVIHVIKKPHLKDVHSISWKLGTCSFLVLTCWGVYSYHLHHILPLLRFPYKFIPINTSFIIAGKDLILQFYNSFSNKYMFSNSICCFRLLQVSNPYFSLVCRVPLFMKQTTVHIYYGK